MTNASREVNSQEWESLIKEYLESGLSAARWCQDKGYSKSKLYWQLRKRRCSNSKSQGVQWISLKSEPEDERSDIKVKIGHAEIIVSDRFNNSLFSEVAKALIALC